MVGIGGKKLDVPPLESDTILGGGGGGGAYAGSCQSCSGGGGGNGSNLSTMGNGLWSSSKGALMGDNPVVRARPKREEGGKEMGQVAAIEFLGCQTVVTGPGLAQTLCRRGYSGSRVHHVCIRRLVGTHNLEIHSPNFHHSRAHQRSPVSRTRAITCSG